MAMYRNIDEVKAAGRGVLDFSAGEVRIINPLQLREKMIDRFIYTAVFTTDAELKKFLYEMIHAAAVAGGAVPSSIYGLYQSAAKGIYHKKTVPAINIRGLTYEVARAVFRAARTNKVGAFIFEIARSEIDYTEQRPAEYAACVLAAAIKEGYQGPVFIQGDHFQFSAKKWQADSAAEMNGLKNLITEALEAGFYNIDIDASTLVNLARPTIEEQQSENARCTAELTKFIRAGQLASVTITIGGEIGEVGKQNSRPEELRAFMKGYQANLPAGMKGLSKISVQTGTSHGGVVLPDGKIARVNLDFATLGTLSQLARREFGLGGAVQHGASTLPDEAFDKFPEVETVEVHLATGFQNIIYQHPQFPTELLREIESYLKSRYLNEKKPGETGEQFIYTTRKKAFGPFKRLMWDMPAENLNGIMATLEDRFGLIFRKLNVPDTAELVNKSLK